MLLCGVTCLLIGLGLKFLNRKWKNREMKELAKTAAVLGIIILIWGLLSVIF